MIATAFALTFYVVRLVILSSVFGFSEARGFRFRRKFTSAALSILGVTRRVRGQAHNQPALYVSNHRSLVDPVVQLNQLDAHVVSKAEVAKYPVLGRGARETGVIFVHRQKTSSRVAAREAIRNALKSGKSVLIYPEGTTSNVATSQEFRLGSFSVAAELGVPVVPVAIDYADPGDYWFEGPMVPFFLRKFGKARTMVALDIGTPVRQGTAVEMMDAAKHWIDRQILKQHQELRPGTNAHRGLVTDQ